jgi:hypothetical protein
MYFDRRLKLFQVTGNTQSPNVRFSGFNKTVLYEVVSNGSKSFWEGIPRIIWWFLSRIL